MDGPFRTRARPTRLGIHALLLGSFAAIGGSLRGFNLLLIIASLLFAALLIQWRFGRRGVWSVSARRRLPADVFAGQPFSVRFQLRNRSRWLSAWMLKLNDPIQRRSGDERDQGSAAVAMIGPGEDRSVGYDCLISRRGRYEFGPSELQSTFPLALVSVRKTICRPQEVMVLPQMLDLRKGWQRRLTSRPGEVATATHRSGWSEGEFFGLRPWRAGDRLKWIHWRTSARLDEPAVRQFSQPRRFELCLVVDGHAADGAESAAAEIAIALAATILYRLTLTPGHRIILAIAGDPMTVLSGGGSDRNRRALLAALAETRLSSQTPVAAAMTQALRRAGRVADCLVVSPRSRELAAADGSLDGMPRLAPPRSVRWINVATTELDDWVREVRG